MSATEPIHPLKHVWLKPRRVFRELARTPLGPIDYVLAAVQGISTYLLLFQFQPSNAHLAADGIVSYALLLGPPAGILGAWLYALLYSRLTGSLGNAASRTQVFHVLAYGSVPMIASALLWAILYAVVGNAVFPGDTPDPDTFVLLLVRIQRYASFLLFCWSYLLQIMGLSELANQRLGRSFLIWLLGQILGGIAGAFVLALLAVLLPNAPAG